MEDRARDPITTAILVGCVVIGAALFGIVTRPVGFLAAIWPANAMLLGLLVAYPRHARPVGWAAAGFAYLLAGYLAGDAPLKNLWLTATNLVGVAIGVMLFRRLDSEHRRLRRALSMLYLFSICVIASAAAAVVGAGMAPFLFGRSVSAGFMFWFTTELSNYVLVLPVLLAAPTTLSWRTVSGFVFGLRSHRNQVAPFGALCLSIAASVVIGGPGAIAFAVPALLWCSISYSLFTTSIVVMSASTALLIAEAAGTMFLPRSYDFLDGTTSFRLGISLMAIGPLTAASITVVQKELQARLERLANLDSLTGILSRRAYLHDSTKLLGVSGSGPEAGTAVIMIDIDHFKQFNDRHGHATGDAVLVAVADALGRELRKTDLFGRLGGEEFAITLPDISRRDAALLAERLRQAVENLAIVVNDETTLGVTISAGLIHCVRPPSDGLQELLPLADAALYQAKSSGRNRVLEAN
ncbi:MAG: diguanylate cyclase [Sphingomonas sp.]